MNKTVELVAAWGEFEENHPNSEIEDFCLYYLSAKRKKENSRELFNGLVIPMPQATLSKLLGWITRLGNEYAQKALADVEVSHYDDFLMLNAVSALKEPKKTEAIYFNFIELSTGLNLLANLKNQGYIIEYDDPNDKRSKRVKLTGKGTQALNECYIQLRKVAALLFNDLTGEDIELCILLLKNIEIKFSSLWPRHKCLSFDEAYKEICGEEK